MAPAHTVFVCSCEGTMRPDGAAIARAFPNEAIVEARHLCRAQIGLFERALGSEAVTVGCTQEAPAFSAAAAAAGFGGQLAFANIRENAGWSGDGSRSGPKMAALLAGAAEPCPDTPMLAVESGGTALIYGRDDVALDAARRLADRLDLTVLLTRPGDIAPPRHADIPIFKGTIRTARGSLGAFELSIDDFAHPAPSSRARLVFGETRHGATSRADVVIDLSGGPPLFPAADLRLGYLRADPADPAAVARVLFEASGLAGTFERPRFIDFHADLCAHSRSRRTGCTRCLDLCPTGAITPAGDHVVIDAGVCAGCGTCAAVCPTGAASYAVPPADALMRRVRAMLTAYRAAGGRGAVLLFHDEAHGAPLIDALARFGDGLPADVVPVAVNETTQVGIETVAAALAWGARAVRFLRRARPRHDTAGLERTIDLAEALALGLGYGPGRAGVVALDDPDALPAALAAIPEAPEPARTSTIMPVGDKRSVLRLAVRALYEAAPSPVDIVALPTPRLLGASRSRWRAARSASPASRPARPARWSTTPTGRNCPSRRTPASNAASAPRPAPRR